MPVAYMYDGTFDGFLTAVFTAYNERENPEELMPCGMLQEAFGRDIREIKTGDAESRRVEDGIVKKMGSLCYRKIWTAFLSCDADKATLLYRYVRRGFEIGGRIYHNIAHPDVMPIEKLCLNVGKEAHLIKEFVRFSHVGGGVYYSKITPKNSVLPMIMPHFADRFSIQPFIIYDAAHAVAGVYNMQGWHLAETDTLAVPSPDEDELNYRRMWKNFYNTIAIAERINPVCRRSHMPMRYWSNMTEHGYIPPEKSKPDSEIISESGNNAALDII